MINEKNFEYLTNQLKYTGFGEGLTEQLRAEMNSGKANLRLQQVTAYLNDQLTTTLYFSRSMQSELYFFNKYEASLKKNTDSPGPTQAFYIGREGANITKKEAYNLLDGRAVFKDLTTKDGKLYQAWLQLNFKQTTPNGNFKVQQYTKNYGYDLIAALQNLPFKEVSVQDERVRLIESLQRGNRQSVTLISPNGDTKIFIEANPQFKAVILSDNANQRINPAGNTRNSQQITANQQQADELSENQGRSKGISR